MHNQKLHFTKRLRQYSLLAVSLTALQARGGAAVIYTDVDPDVTLIGWGDCIYGGGCFEIDFDGDGVREFRISHSRTSSGYGNDDAINLTAASGASAIGFVSSIASPWGYLPVGTFAEAFSIGAPIDPTANFYASPGIQIGSYTNYAFSDNERGIWGGLNDRYLGVRFDNASGTHYGWIRLDVGSKYSSVTIKDFAYESIPDQPILAGSTGNCPSASGGTASILSSTEVQLDWDSVALADKYLLKGGPLSSGIAGARISETNSFVIDELEPGETYGWIVKVGCVDSTISVFSAMQTFTMPASAAESRAKQEVYDAISLGLEIHNEAELESVNLYDINGRLVASRKNKSDYFILPLDKLPSGSYILEMVSLDGRKVRKVIAMGY